MVDIFTPGINLLLTGVGLGACIGWAVHAIYIRRYLKKHAQEHPEFKIYLETLQKSDSNNKNRKPNKKN